jgi:hypothetical protein
LPDPPAAPTNLVATAAGASQIDLTWFDVATTETGFVIERSPGGANSWTEVGQVGANETVYSDTGLAADTTYDYRAAAVNGIVKSTYSNVDSATTNTAGDLTLTIFELAESGDPGRRGNRWNATVTITIVNQGGFALPDATILWSWSAGTSGSGTCVTNASGQCSVTKANIKTSVTSVTFTVNDVQHASHSYTPGALTSVDVLWP